MNLDWYPSQEDKLAAFLLNFVTVIDAVTALLDLPPGTFDPAKKAAQVWLDAKKKRDDAYKAYAQAQKDFTDQEPLTDKAVREAVRQIKNTANVPNQALTDLELNTGHTAPLARVAAQHPDLKLSESLGKVTGKYTKHGHQAVDVYSRRSGETTFTLLGRYSLNTFMDERPNLDPAQAEEREYYAIYVDKDQQVGDPSPVVSIAVGTRRS